ncbi:ATP-binding cassette domain-containing protein [Streptosporangium sp. V21-05]|uniref:ATP-binding cassette domain-containing protein n=1 Tax=Streptosporangium sp. V21-05 TaxID=3446115 RepID=UPI003F53904E
MTTIVRCAGVSRTYGTGGDAVVAVHGLTCAVKDGGRIAVVGSSGSGKTTLLHLLAGLDEPTTGEIHRQDVPAGVEPLQHRFAYVGSDLQDLYGIRPATLPRTTRLQDAYFVGGSARTMMDRLARRPDAILVSQETVHDFQLHLGDQLRLRLQDGRTGQLRTVTFHYAGVAAEFPTAPRDSFLVANAAYVAARTGSDAVGSFLVSTDGTPAGTVADRLRTIMGPHSHITDLDTTRKVIGSSLTAVDFGGLATVELTLGLALALTATALLLILGFTERRRTFALAAVLGARPRQLGAFVWTEVAVVGAGTTLFAALGGWALSHMLVTVLSGVFDPPPSALALPRRRRRPGTPQRRDRRATSRPPPTADRPARPVIGELP